MGASPQLKQLKQLDQLEARHVAGRARRWHAASQILLPPPCATHFATWPCSSSGRALSAAARKSPWRVSSWHQFSKYSNRG